MKKKLVRLTDSDLHNIIKESVKKVLNETITNNEYQILDGIKFKVFPKHISEIKPGDVILVDNKLKTVGKKDLKYDKFMGVSIWGDSYKSGNELVNYCEIYNVR